MVGVSLNIAIPNFVMDAVNAAYRVVVPKDAVAGIPTEYGAAIIANTLSLLATITTHRRAAAGVAAARRGDFVTDTADTAPEAHSVRADFPKSSPAEHAPPELGRFVAALRRLQDLTVSTDPGGSAWTTAARTSKTPARLLDGHQVPAALAPAGRVIELPGLGHPLMPPWTVPDSGPRRRHHGGALHPSPRGRKQRRARRHDPAVL